MFPSKKALDKTINDLNNKASILIKFQGSPKKNIKNPDNEKYKTLKESAKPMYSKASLTMDGNGLYRDYRPQIRQTNRRLHPSPRGRESSVGDSDTSSKNSRSSSFENEESDEEHIIDEQLKNNHPLSFSSKSNNKNTSIDKDEPLGVNWTNNETPKLDKDYFLVRTYHRGGCCLVKVPLEPEEVKIIKTQKDIKAASQMLTNSHIQDMIPSEKLDDNVLRKPSMTETDSMKDFTEFCHSRLEMNSMKDFTDFCQSRLDTDIMKDFNDLCHSRLETGSMKDFTEFCHNRLEKENVDKNEEKPFSNSVLQDSVNTENTAPSINENVTFASLLNEFNLLHIMDDSGKIVWNSSTKDYKTDTKLWDEKTIMNHKSNKECNANNILQNASKEGSLETKRQCNIEIDNGDIVDNVKNNVPPKHNLGDNDNLEVIPNGFRHEVQSPDPRMYMDSFGTNQYLILNSEPSEDNFV